MLQIMSIIKEEDLNFMKEIKVYSS